MERPPCEFMMETYSRVPDHSDIARLGLPSGLTITHLPTGVEVRVDWYGSQFRNKLMARRLIDFLLDNVYAPETGR